MNNVQNNLPVVSSTDLSLYKSKSLANQNHEIITLLLLFLYVEKLIIIEIEEYQQAGSQHQLPAQRGRSLG